MASKVKIMSASDLILHKKAILGEHHHPHYQLYYIIDGYPTFVIDGTELHAFPGSIFYIPPNTQHRMLPLSSPSFYYEFKIHIEDLYIASNLKKISPVIEADKFTKKVMDHIYNNWFYTNPQNVENCESLMVSIFLGFFLDDLHYKYEKAKTSRISSEGYNDITQRIMSYISINHRKSFSLDDMARELNYNSSYMSYAFSKNAGMSIVDYLNLYRMRVAVSMLCFFSYDVHATRERVGFSSASHFSRTFKKYTGTTPQSFKTVFSGESRKSLQYLFSQEPILSGSMCTIEEALVSLKSVGNVVKEIQGKRKDNKKHL
ncbi:MAG: helix-turn-helix domain-containing protein [Oscillospiraceae bacterium]|nr:helix-turn-helix domain-containing protein [Oscillospiraceae bacterium]